MFCEAFGSTDLLLRGWLVGLPCIGPPPRPPQHHGQSQQRPPHWTAQPNQRVAQGAPFAAAGQYKQRRQSVASQGGQGGRSGPNKPGQRRDRLDSGFWSTGMGCKSDSGAIVQ